MDETFIKHQHLKKIVSCALSHGYILRALAENILGNKKGCRSILL
jgi:hypothetical protein